MQALEGIVLGWGRSEDKTKKHENIPKLLKVAIQNNDECLLKNRKLVDLASSRTFCGAGFENGSGVCSGDGGTGLFVIIDGICYLKGIVSSSLIKDSDCDVSKPAIYTNVLKHTEWIQRGTKGAYATKGHLIKALAF